MIEIRNELGDTLQLPLDETLTVEINSTIFETSDILQGSYSYPFSFSLKNDNNREFIQNGHLPERLLQPDIPVTVVAGSITFAAKLKYQVDSMSADGALLIDLSTVANLLRNVSLREYVTEEFEVGTADGMLPPSPSRLAHAFPGQYPIVFPCFRNDEMVEEDFERDPAFTRPTICNPFNLNTGQYTFTVLGKGDAQIVPMVYLTWLLKYVCNKLGFTASGSFFQDSPLSRIILFNTQTTPGLTDDGRYHVIIGRHLPDITIGDFLKNIRAYFGITIDFNAREKRAVFNLFKDINRMQLLDLSPYFIPGTQGLEEKASGGYTVNVLRDDNDKMIADEKAPFLNYKVGDATLGNVDLNIGTLRMVEEKIVDLFPLPSPTWLIPKVSMPGNLADPFFKKLENPSALDPDAAIYAESENYCPYWNPDYPGDIPELKNDFGFKLLIFWGMQPDSTGRNYPYASSLSYNGKYQTVGKLSLLPGEVDDMWENYQRIYYEFLALSKNSSAFLRLPASVLSSISPSEPIGLRLSNFVLSKYLLDRLSYELPAKEGYFVAKFEGRQLMPMILKPNQSEFPQIVWLELRLEKLPGLNWQPTEAPGYREYESPTTVHQRQTLFADVVVYVWADGLYTIPVTNVYLSVDYAEGWYDMNRTPNFISTYNPILKVENTKKVDVAGHRTVIATKTWIYKSQMYTESIPFRAYSEKMAYTLKPGKGFRLKR